MTLKSTQLSLKVRILIITLALLLLSLLATSTVTIMSLLDKNKKDIVEFSENENERVKGVLQNYVDVAFESIQSIYEKSQDMEHLENVYGSRLESIIDVADGYILSQIAEVETGFISQKLAQERVKSFIDKLRYEDGSGYIWINDIGLPYPTMIHHPTVPGLNGEILNDPKYNCALGKGQNLFQAMVEVTAASPTGDGFVDYMWPKPSEDGLTENQMKLSYVRLIPQWNWIIGTGIYVDDAVEEAKKSALEIVQQMRYDNGVGYFWINDTNQPYPSMIMHPILPELNGKILNDPKYNCAMGTDQNLFQAAVEVTNSSTSGSGYVDYLWPKPVGEGVTLEQPKISYVRQFEAWQWIIGTGVYTDNIALAVSLRQEDMTRQIYKIISMSIILTIGIAAVAMFVLTLYISRSMKPLQQMQEVASLLSNGDLTREVSTTANDDIGMVVKSFNSFQSYLKKTMIGIKKLSSDNNDMGMELTANTEESSAALEQVTQTIESFASQIVNLDSVVISSLSATDSILESSKILDEEIVKQNESLFESSAGIEEINANLQNVRKISEDKGRTAQTLMSRTQDGELMIRESISGIQKVSDITEGIKEIVKVIKGISSQTNLLAMNAAIEAAHAGNAGKGFAVVADEIRKLAESTAANTQTIAKEIDETINAIEVARKSSEDGGEIFHQIAEEVRSVTDSFYEISNAITEISHSSNEIMHTVSDLKQISVVVKENSTSVQDSTRGIHIRISELQEVSNGTRSGIEEISVGVQQINKAVRDTADLSEHTSVNLNKLKDLVDFFQT